MSDDSQQDEPVVYASVEEALDLLDRLLTLTVDETAVECTGKLLRKIKESPEVLQPLLDRLRDLTHWWGQHRTEGGSTVEGRPV